MKNLVATVAALLQVRAKVGNNEVVIFRSSMMNSIYGNIPIRYSYEKESDQNVLTEDSRLNSEIAELKPCNLRPHVDCDLNYRLIPSLYDGKQKKIKTKTP